MSQYQNKIALIPGGFKPPTLGHFHLVDEISKYNEITEVLVLIGHGVRDGITIEHSKQVWEVYSKYLSDKVKIQPSTKTSPVGEVISIIKNNPDNFYFPVVGIRGEEDDADRSRFSSIEGKYNNFKPIVFESNLGVSGTKARKEILNNNFEGFQRYIPTELNNEDREKIWNILTKDSINEEENYPYNVESLIQKHGISYKDFLNKLNNGFDVEKTIDSTKSSDYIFDIVFFNLWDDINYYNNSLNENLYHETIDYKSYIKDLTSFLQSKYPHIDNFPEIKLIHNDSNNASNFLGKTAYYDPIEDTIYVYTEGRHPKDIVRSFSHEYIHFIQDQENRLNDINTTNTNEDDNLLDIEKEAYLEGNINFRNWTDHITQTEVDTSLQENNYSPWLNLDKELDSIYSDIGIDAELTKHFKQRVKQRNLTHDEIVDLMSKIKEKYGEEISQYPEGTKKVFSSLKDLTDIVVHIDKDRDDDGKREMDLVTAFKRESPKDSEFRLGNTGQLKVAEIKSIDFLNIGNHIKEMFQENPIKIYVDMDGVLADFDSRFTELSGIPPSEYKSKHGEEKFWNFVDKDNKIKFWVGIKPMEGAKDLISFVNNYDYELLTSPSKDESSRLGKRLWVKNNVGKLFPSKPKINFKFSSYKQTVKPSLNSNDILIDDREDIISNWNKAGGTGILYLNSSQVIKDLQKILNNG